jgi:DNA repair exonuclease SbcCD ATPase subunit
VTWDCISTHIIDIIIIIILKNSSIPSFKRKNSMNQNQIIQQPLNVLDNRVIQLENTTNPMQQTQQQIQQTQQQIQQTQQQIQQTQQQIQETQQQIQQQIQETQQQMQQMQQQMQQTQQQIQQQMQQMQQQMQKILQNQQQILTLSANQQNLSVNEKNRIYRLLNKSVGYGDPLLALLNQAGKASPIFPASKAALLNYLMQQLNDLIQFYNIPLQGGENWEDKFSAISIFIGY